MFPEHENEHRILKKTYVGNFLVSTVCLDFTTAMYETMVFECDPEDEDVTGDVVDRFTCRSTGRREAEGVHGYTVERVKGVREHAERIIKLPCSMQYAYQYAELAQYMKIEMEKKEKEGK